MLSPLRPVFNDPVLVAVVRAVADCQHGVVEVGGVTLGAGVDSLGVKLELVPRRINGHTTGSITIMYNDNI